MSSVGTNPNFVKGLTDRQAVSAAALVLTLADFVARGNVIDLQAPAGSVIVNGDVVVDTASDDTGTDTLSVGDDGSAARYHAAIDLKTAARTALTPTGYQTDGHTPAFRLTRAPQNGNATVLTVRVNLVYVTVGKSEWTEGPY